MSNVIDNLGRIKVALSGAGSWPFSQIWTVSQAEPLADFSTIANAIAGVGTGDGILLDAENFNETLTINVFVYLLGLAPDLSTINGKITSSQASNLENLKVEVTSAEAIEITSLVFSYNYIKNCTFNATTGSGLKAIWDKIGYNFYNCNASAYSGSGNQYGYYFQPGSALTSNIYGGIYRGTTADIYADTNATINLFGPVLYNSTIAGPGTVNGWFYDVNGGLHRVGSGGTSQYVKQATANGALTVGTIAAADLPAASESAAGAAEIATQAETDAGADDARIVTPLKLANAATVNKTGYKNLLYSSMCHDLWQEGTTLNDLADDTYGPDTVWNVLNKSNAPDISGQAGGASDPFTRSFRCTFDAANEQAGIVQFLEAEDTYPLRGQTVSLSADLWGTNVGTLRMAVIEWTSTADALTSDVVGTWGTGNPTLATNWAYIGTPAAITISGTRTRYEVENLTVGASTNNLGVFIWTDANEGSGDLWNVARVQLEIGPVATAFQARPFGVEYELVSRFWLKSYALATAPGTATNVNREAYQTRRALAGTTAGTPLIETVMFPYRMRVAPTVVLYSTSTGTANAIYNNNAAADRTGCTAGSVGDNRFGQVDADNTSATAIALDQALSFHYTASARL